MTSITIPNSVTSIGDNVFECCSSLTSITIPDSVTSIGSSAFYECGGLNSVIIPNTMTSIGDWAFGGCSSLTSVTIGNSVRSFGYYAFNNDNLKIVKSLIEEPMEIRSNTFSENTLYNGTLIVPNGTIEKYKATEGWNKFQRIEEDNGTYEEPTTPTCETPIICYSNGKLTFNCATEGATCQYSITDSDIKTGSGNEVELTASYKISVYATKTGYNNSATATATLCWIDVEPKTEGMSNGVAQVPAKAVLIQTNGGSINVQGCNDGEQVGVYSIDGSQVGSAVSQNGAAAVNTSLQPGSVAIIKVGEKSVKVIMK